MQERAQLIVLRLHFKQFLNLEHLDPYHAGMEIIECNLAWLSRWIRILRELWISETVKCSPRMFFFLIDERISPFDASEDDGDRNEAKQFF
jgi:hypothetical protein